MNLQHLKVKELTIQEGKEIEGGGFSDFIKKATRNGIKYFTVYHTSKPWFVM